MRDSRLAARSLNKQRHNPSVNESSKSVRKHKPDYVLVVLMSLLLVCGAVVVYAIGPSLTGGTDLGENYFSSKQLTAILLGIIGFIIASTVPLNTWKKLQPLVIGLAILAAITVRFFGDEVNGVHRWIQVGGFSFQPAELIKLALVLWIAGFLSKKRLEGKVNDPDTLKHLGIVMIAIVVVVAGLQSDLGSAAVMMAIMGVTTFIAGLPIRKLGLVILVFALLTTVAISTSEYRRDRVSTFLNPTADCQAEGYQACQALITIGSGGIFGKGLGRSVQAYGYLPEPANDSIFAIIAEKFGFVGTVSLIGVFWILFLRIANIARTASTEYSRLLVSGILVWLSVQTVINIGAMLGLLPLKGITLPFVSYGGTSIIFVMVAMGIVFQSSRYTDIAMTSQLSTGNGRSRTEPTRYSRRSV